MQNTKISWATHTFNPWLGCAKVSAECLHCYAEALMADRFNKVIWGKDGTRKRTQTWGDPLKWDRQAAKEGDRPRVFCASLADIFEDFEGLQAWRDELWELVDRTTNLEWLLLSKHLFENMAIGHDWRDYVPKHWRDRLPDHVRIGTTAGTQNSVDRRVPQLYKIPAKNFVSAEPLLEDIDFNFGSLRCLKCGNNQRPIALVCCDRGESYHDGEKYLKATRMADHVIVGGESQQGIYAARRFDLDWARSVRDQCQAREIPFFFKQAGSNPILDGKPYKCSNAHGTHLSDMPKDLRYQQLPMDKLAGKQIK